MVRGWEREERRCRLLGSKLYLLEAEARIVF